ncbi:hypothetical protein BTUL_0016g00010 [Botrytis tulipae]|uniref:Uncharacterized protein n=1 Tax=Botrytis tulipae TaxID=87230 RepID=A0A4Z1F209_9HELO|nr:hypothetical protein BTUL_0016g00010 [Botrytis tulipae]
MLCSPGTAIHIRAGVHSTTPRTLAADGWTTIIEAACISPITNEVSRSQISVSKNIPDPWATAKRKFGSSRTKLVVESSSRQVVNRGSSAPYQSSRENLNRPYKPAKRGSSNQVRKQQNRKRDVQREPRSLAREPISEERNLDWMAEFFFWKPTSGEN